MSNRWWITLSIACTLAVSGTPVLAQGHGHDKDKDKEEHGRGHDKDSHDYYREADRDAIRHWYGEHEREGLPPGLAKKDQLSPGLEKQLAARGQLPPGLQKKIQPCPPELVRRLPPPPPDCVNVVIGGHFVLLNRKTNLVIDIFHLEIR